LPKTKKLILVVIDGLTPSMFESAVGDGRAPALSFLAEQGSYSRAISTFPSLTPVCLSSIATGSHPNVHRIPHLVWYDRERARLVEYGSSFGAVRAAGVTRSLIDTTINLNRLHLGTEAVTVYEALEDAGLTAAAINITCYRGRTPHLPTLPGLTFPAYGPKRFFFYNLFESDPTGAPLAVFGRSHGSIDGYAAAVGRWLVTRDGFDFLVYYLPDYDFASHAHGPDGAFEALARSDAAVGALLDAAGGPEEFLERYAVVLCSNHGQTHVAQHVRLESSFGDLDDVLVTASNRAGMLYRLGDAAPGRALERDTRGWHLLLGRGGDQRPRAGVDCRRWPGVRRVGGARRSWPGARARPARDDPGRPRGAPRRQRDRKHDRHDRRATLVRLEQA